MAGYGSVIDMAGQLVFINMIDTVNANIRPSAQLGDWLEVGKYFEAATETVDCDLDDSACRRIRLLWLDTVAEQLVEGLRDARATSETTDEQLRLM